MCVGGNRQSFRRLANTPCAPLLGVNVLPLPASHRLAGELFFLVGSLLALRGKLPSPGTKGPLSISLEKEQVNELIITATQKGGGGKKRRWPSPHCSVPHCPARCPGVGGVGLAQGSQSHVAGAGPGGPHRGNVGDRCVGETGKRHRLSGCLSIPNPISRDGD